MAKPHQIHLLQFDFSVIQAAGESVANDLQRWVQVSLLPVIDEVLEQVSAELGLANSVAYRLGKLTLDLGSVFADESDIETARRLRSQLTTLLLEQLSGQLRPSSQTMSDVSVQIESLTQHHAILQGFLQTGRLNWEHSAHPSVAHRQVLRHALTERRQAVAILADEQLEFLRGVVRDERQCTRLLRQYETSELLLVARHFLNTWPVQQAELALDWISLELSRLESDTNGARCEKFWRYVLNTLEASVQSKDQQALKLVTPWLLDCAGRHALSVHDVEPEPETNALAAYQSFIEKNTRISNQAKAALQQVLANLRQPLLLSQAINYATDKVTLTEADLQGHLQAANLDVLSLHWQSLMTRQAHTVRHIYVKLNAQQKAQLIAALPLQKQIELVQILRPASASLTAEIAQAAEQLAKIISQEAETITANQLCEQWCRAILTDDTDEQHVQVASASLLHKIIAPHLAATNAIWQSLQVALIYQHPQLIHTRAALAAINATMPNESEKDVDQNTMDFEHPSFDIEIEQIPAHKADITRLLQQAKQTPASLQANLRKLIQNKNTFADFVNQLSEAHRHQLMIALISSAASENTSEVATSAAYQLLQKIENEAYQSRNIRSYIVSALQQLIEDQAIDFDILRAKYPASNKGELDSKGSKKSRAGASRHSSDTTTVNTAGYIHPAPPETISVQSSETKQSLATTHANQTREPTNRHSSEGGNPEMFVGVTAHFENEQDLTALKNKIASSKSLLNSLPFKRRARVEMGVGWKWTVLKSQPKPIPTFPLKGKELTVVSQELIAPIDNDLINDEIPSQPADQTRSTQTPTPLDSRLRGNEVSSFVENEIDTPINAINKNQITGRAGATRELQKSVDENLTSYTRPTTSEAAQIQSAVTEHNSVTTQANQAKEPTSRQSREGGNPVAFVEQGVQSENGQNLTAFSHSTNKTVPTKSLLNSLPSKGKELEAMSQGLTAAIDNDLINGGISGKPELTGNTQNPTPLDSRLRGNDVSTFVENEIDEQLKTNHQNQTTSRASATSHLSDTTTANSAGFTRPTTTTPETTQVQSAEAKRNSAPMQANQTKEPTSRHSREGGNPVAFVEKGVQSENGQNLTAFSHSTNKTVPTKSLLNSLPSKGKELEAMSQGLTAAIDNDLINGGISGKPELTGNTQNPTPLDSRLRGNDVSTFVENEIDTPIKTIHQNQTTSRASATSHLSDETTINLVGYTHPTIPEPTQIQSTETKYNSATTQANKTKEPTSRHSREGGNPESFVEQVEQIGSEKDLTTFKDEPAPTKSLLNSLPFKGRARVGMGGGWKWTALKAEPRPIPIPSFPLKGKELTTVSQGLTATTSSDVLNGEILNKSVEQTRNTQNPTSLDSRLRGNDASLFAENGIDTPINATHQNQITRRAGATRHVSETTTANSAGYTRPTTSAATQIQSAVTEHYSVTTQANQTKEPTSRHSREGGNPESFVEQAEQIENEKNLIALKNKPAPIEAPLNSLPLKGKELTTASQGLTATTSSDVLNGEILNKSVEPTGNTQNPTPLDSRLRGNDASPFAENGIDEQPKTTHQNQTTSRAGATRHVSDTTVANSSGFTRPTTPKTTQVQSTEAERNSATTQANQRKEPISRHSREGGNPVAFVEQAEQIENEKNLIALKNEPAPTKSLLNSLPFKGRARVGMGVSWKWTALKAEPRPIPIPTFPLKGKELTTASQGLTATTSSDVLNGEILNKSVEQTGNTQTATPLDSRLRGNDASSFAENGIDEQPKTTHQNQTTSRAGATRHVSDTTTANSAGYTRPTTPEPTQVQSTEAKRNSATTQANQRNESTSRHSREGGNPASFVEQFENGQSPTTFSHSTNKTAPSESLLYPLPFKGRARVGMGVSWKRTALKSQQKPITIPAFPLKGKELTVMSEGLTAAIDNNLINGGISDKLEEPTGNTQNPTSLDSRLRGNDASLFAENGIDTPINATHQNKTTSRAGATRHVSEPTTANSAGYTRPTTPEPMQVQSAEAKHNSATTQPNQPKEPTSRHSREGGNPESIDEQAEQIEYEQNPTELSYSTNRTAPSKAPLNSLPFKERARVGMGVGWKWTALKSQPKPIPIPTFPLKGMELTAMPQGLRAATDNNLINGGISGKLDEPTGNTQNPTPLDSRLRGNDVSTFVENEIDTPIKTTHQNQTTSRAGATRHVSDTTNVNLAGYTRPTTPETTQVQSAKTEHIAVTSQLNQTKEPTSRHSRERGNPESFVEQAEQIGNGKNLIALKNETAPIEAPLNSLPFKGRARVGMGVSWKWTALKAEPKPIPIPALPLKGKELTTELHGLTAAVDNDLISGEILSQSVEQTRSIQTPTSLDSHLRGNDVSTFAENGVDEQLKTTHQNQTTSRAGATRHVSDTTTVNPAGCTLPTTPESTQIQSTETKHISATTQENQTKESSAVPPREDANTAAFTGKKVAIQNDQANTSKQTTASQEPTQTRPDQLKARLPQRLARALLQADLRELDDVWDKLINEYADLFAQSLRIYLKKAELRQALIVAHTPEKMLESLQVLSPSVSQLLRECWESWSTFSGFTTEKNKSAFQHYSLSLVWDALFDVDLATQTKLTQVRQLVALLLPQPSSQSQTTQPSFAASRHPNYLTQIARLHHRLSASTAPLWHNSLTQILTMDSRIAEIAVLDESDLDQADVSLISYEEIRQSLLMELSHQDSVELHIAATWFEQEWQDDSGEPSSAPMKARINSLATYLHQEHAEQSATVHIDQASPAQQHDYLEQLILLTQTTRTLSTAEKIHLRSLFAYSLSNAIKGQSAPTRLQQELHAMLEHDAVIDRLCLCLNDVTLERIFVFLHADLLAPAKQIAIMMKSVFAIELCEQADFFHNQAWRLIYRAANDMSQEEIVLPSTVAAASQRARHFQAALMKEIAAHYALGSVSACCEKIRQASVVEAAKISQTHTQTPAQQQTQATRLTKKINKPMPEPEQGEVEAYVLNAGMVIVAPYVQRLFGMFELTRDGAFVDEDAAQRAVHLLQYIVTGESATPEYQLSLNKLLCGIHGGVPIVAGIEITEHEKEVIAQMLQGVIAHWNALGNTSIDGLRQTFFVRQGQLRHEEDAWYLQIPQSTFDMLLDRLPWSFAMIKFPWMPEPLHVSWRT